MVSGTSKVIGVQRTLRATSDHIIIAQLPPTSPEYLRARLVADPLAYRANPVTHTPAVKITMEKNRQRKIKRIIDRKSMATSKIVVRARRCVVMLVADGQFPPARFACRHA